MSGEVPEGWREAKLGDHCRIEIGGTPLRDKPQFWSNEDMGHPWVSIADLKTASVASTKEFISDLGVANSNVKLVPRGTVMMSFKLTIGRAAIAGRDLYTNEAIAAFFPDSGVDNEFLFYALPHAAGGAETDQAIKGATLNKAKLRDLSVPLPPLDEQRRIAEVLRSVDEAIASANDVGRAGEIVFRRRREELIGEARRASSEITVAAALRKNRGEKLLKLQTDRYADAGRYPIVDQGARFICGFTDEESAVWPYDLPVIVFGDHTRILKFVDFPFVIGADGTQCLNPIEGIQPRYFYYALQSLDLQAEGYARHFKLLKEKTVPVPTLHEQTAIERELAAIEAAVAEAQQARLKLAGLKAALAEQLLSGRVRVPA